MYFSETDNEILLSFKFSADFRPKLISWITFHLLEIINCENQKFYD